MDGQGRFWFWGIARAVWKGEAVPGEIKIPLIYFLKIKEKEKKGMRKNVWSFLVCAAMAAGMLSGCSGSSKSETEGAKAEGTSAGAAGEAETKKEEADRKSVV